MIDPHGACDPEATRFAKAGRASADEIAAQLRRTLEDPCVRVVLDAVTGYVMILNAQRQILAANQELLEALGRRENDCLLGLRPGEAFNCIHFTEGTDGCGTAPHCRTCGSVLAVLAAQRDGLPATDECRLSFYRDGQLQALDLRVRATPFEVDGEPLLAFVLHDVSAVKRRDVLEQTFLHDFLNTVGGLAGWSDLLRGTGQDVIAREIAALAESLKEDVLTQRTLLAAERGELVVRLQDFDPANTLARLDVLFRQHPIARGKTLLVEPLLAPVRLVTDEALLLRVLVNMVKNAFEATADGGVVRCWFEWRGDAPAFVVQNAGVLSDHVRARLFERSFSMHPEAGRGLGTYSMKLYGERYLGGTVGFASDDAQGTRFVLALPPTAIAGSAPAARRAASPQAAAEPASDRGAGRLRILFVEDDDSLLRLGTLLLGRLGHAVTGFREAPAAVAAFAADPAGFDLVITDWSMPAMGGGEFLARLTALRPDVRALVCTGLSESGVAPPPGVHLAGVLMKPFTFEQLGRALAQAVAPVGAAPA